MGEDLYFTFKQFKIKHNKSSMRVGTDAILFGCWVNSLGLSDNFREVEHLEGEIYRVLDVGCGCGVISLILAQCLCIDVTVCSDNCTYDTSESGEGSTINSERGGELAKSCDATFRIKAIDIHKDSCLECAENIKASPWKDIISCECLDFKAYKSEKKYDLIVSNPPFFSNSLKNPDKTRENARHKDNSLPFKSLISSSEGNLSENGSLCLIIPLSELEIFRNDLQSFNTFDCIRDIKLNKNIEETAEKNCKSSANIGSAHSLFINRITYVKTMEHKQPKRVLLHVSRKEKSIKEDSIIIQNSNNTLTDEFKQLTANFYLNF